MEAPVELAQPYGHQQAAASADSLSSSMEAPSVVHPASVAPPLEQLAKAEPVVQQSPHYPFLGVSNYPGFGLMPQIPGAQYSYEQAEPQQQDVSRIPSLMVKSWNSGREMQRVQLYVGERGWRFCEMQSGLSVEAELAIIVEELSGFWVNVERADSGQGEGCVFVSSCMAY